MTNFRRLLSVALVATCITAVNADAAGKRRSVKHPGSPNRTIQGTVIDDVTGQPVVSASVEGGGRDDVTNSEGKFELEGVPAAGTIELVVTRTGYNEKRTTVTASGGQNVTIRLTPRPTVTVRKTDNTTIQLDDDSVEFGFTDAFSYRSSSQEEFCRPDGTQIVVKREEIARIVGPATLAPSAPCCTAQPTVQKVNVTLKAGGTTDLFFSDTCNFTRSVDLVGRDHVTGKKVFIPFSQIAEVVFP